MKGKNLKYIKSKDGEPSYYKTDVTINYKRYRHFAGYTKEEAKAYLKQLIVSLKRKKLNEKFYPKDKNMKKKVDKTKEILEKILDSIPIGKHFHCKSLEKPYIKEIAEQNLSSDDIYYSFSVYLKEVISEINSNREKNYLIIEDPDKYGNSRKLKTDRINNRLPALKNTDFARIANIFLTIRRDVYNLNEILSNMNKKLDNMNQNINLELNDIKSKISNIHSRLIVIEDNSRKNIKKNKSNFS